MQPSAPQNPKSIFAGLTNTQLALQGVLRHYQQLQKTLAHRAHIGYTNNQNIISLFQQVASHSFKPIQLLLRFLEQKDILAIAATCLALRKLLFSPMGFRIIRALRPVIVRIKKQQKITSFNKSYLQNLCSDVNMSGLDEDDKIAIVQTMKTNLMAARQKMKQIQHCNILWQQRKNAAKQQITKIAIMRQQQARNIQSQVEHTQKLVELLKESASNIERLRGQQEKMLVDREIRRDSLVSDKEKLQRQKELLIKKIKAQQKEREEALVYAKEVRRVTQTLTKLTAKK